MVIHADLLWGPRRRFSPCLNIECTGCCVAAGVVNMPSVDQVTPIMLLLLLLQVPKIGRNIALNIKHSWDAKMESRWPDLDTT